MAGKRGNQLRVGTRARESETHLVALHTGSITAIGDELRKGGSNKWVGGAAAAAWQRAHVIRRIGEEVIAGTALRGAVR